MSTSLPRVASSITSIAISSLLFGFSAGAQESKGRAIIGRVVDESGQAVPYATIAANSGTQVTAQPDGTFRLTMANQTNVTIVIRQIGFHPESLTVAIDPVAASSIITVKLARNPIVLSQIRINEQRLCNNFDPTDSTAVGALRPVFDALQENVNRTLMLLRAFPIRAEMALTFYDSSESGRGKLQKHDGNRMAEGIWLKYEPGGVIKLSERGTMIVPVSLGFLVDSVFRSRHCFQIAREELSDQRSAIRVDFAPNSLITGVDWAGSVLLDEKSYVVRATRFSLTYPETARGEQQHMNWSIAYDEIFPGLTDMASDRRISWKADGSRVAERGKISVIETQTIKRTFVKGAPGAASGESIRR